MFYNEDPPNPSKRCILKEVFSNCRTFGGKLSSASPDEEYPPSDSDNEEEVVVSAIRSKAREAKMRRKSSLLSDSFKSDSFSRVFSTRTGELIATPKQLQKMEDDEEEREDYFSVRSYLSRASSLTSGEGFLSVKTNLSRCSSMSGIDFYEFRRPPSIIQELCHCEGWPFGLCRRALLLPPLPKSPSESWSWRKGTRVVKMN